MSDLVERLREYTTAEFRLPYQPPICHEAADEIERLRRELMDEEVNYTTLTDLLRSRFPKNADGTYPDHKIEDVLRENERLRQQIAAAESCIAEEFTKEWLEEHCDDDHMVTIDHKDEMYLCEVMLNVLRILRGTEEK